MVSNVFAEKGGQFSNFNIGSATVSLNKAEIAGAVAGPNAALKALAFVKQGPSKMLAAVTEGLKSVFVQTLGRVGTLEDVPQEQRESFLRYGSPKSSM